jgi:hypothetical protein
MESMVRQRFGPGQEKSLSYCLQSGLEGELTENKRVDDMISQFGLRKKSEIKYVTDWIMKAFPEQKSKVWIRRLVEKNRRSLHRNSRSTSSKST